VQRARGCIRVAAAGLILPFIIDIPPKPGFLYAPVNCNAAAMRTLLKCLFC
jgi:hypothetical protein